MTPKKWLVALLLMFASCAYSYPNSSVSWEGFPSSGVHVGGRWSGNDDGWGKVRRHDVIMEIDGDEMVSAKSVYARLSDGAKHQVLFYDVSMSRTSTTTMRLESNELLELGLVGLGELEATPGLGKEPRSQGLIWGFILPIAKGSTPTDEIELPRELAGSFYVVVDYDMKSAAAESVAGAVKDYYSSSGPRLPTVLLRGSVGEGFDSSLWSETELRFTDRYPDIVTLASMPSELVDQRGRVSGNPFYSEFSWAPYVLVVDCHGVVRWYSHVTALMQAYEFADQLGSRKRELCWAE